MKIKSETADQISLYDRSSGPIFGPILIIVGAIVSFIHVSNGPAWVVPLIAAVLVIFGIALLLFSPSFTVDITKSEIHYKRKAMVGKGMDQTFNSADVAQIVVQESIRQSYNNRGNNGQMIGGMQTNITFQTFLLFKNGLQLPIDNGGSGSSGLAINGIGLSTGNKEISIAQKVATFLGVPMQGGQPSMPMMPNIQI